MKAFVNEFKEFIMRGNVIDMAVGVIIGGAFNNIVSSLVNDIVMPVITLITGKINFTDMLIALDGNSYSSLSAAKEAAAPVIAYGNFIQIVVQFLLTHSLFSLSSRASIGCTNQHRLRLQNRLQRSARSASLRFTLKQSSVRTVLLTLLNKTAKKITEGCHAVMHLHETAAAFFRAVFYFFCT